jgi:serine/threonine protein kinase/Tfp pilus assembly protein PilF
MPPDSSCPQVQELHYYLQGELPAGTRALLEQHLKQCRPCQHLLTSLEVPNPLASRAKEHLVAAAGESAFLESASTTIPPSPSPAASLDPSTPLRDGGTAMLQESSMDQKNATPSCESDPYETRVEPLSPQVRERPAALAEADPYQTRMSGTLTNPPRPQALPLATVGNVARVPGYEILDTLGRGGMGVVYKARQTSLNRVVALKMILAGGDAEAEVLARFRAEAEVVARIQHPHIVQIYEIGTQDGLPFFSLEFCSGGPLSRKIAGTPQPSREVAEIVAILARAMHEVHRRGIVHRDLKPANILLSLKPASGSEEPGPAAEPADLPLAAFSPKIGDFGLAKQLDAAAGQTRSGEVLGTPSYMAPEQAQGKVKEIGPRTDVYALGAILYELLTGRPPFKGASPIETLAQVLDDEPVPPHRLQPKIPRDLETICLKCLRKEAVKRYASAEDLAADLERFRDDQPIRARPVSVWERGVKWARRRPTQAALTAAIGLLAATLLLGALASYGRYKDQQTRFLVGRGKVDDRQKLAQNAEDAGNLVDAEQLWGEALATLDAEPDVVTPDLRREFEARKKRVHDSRTEADERQRKRLEEQDLFQKLQGQVNRFQAGREKVLDHEISFTDQDQEASRAKVRQAAEAALEALDLRMTTPPAHARRCLAEYGRIYPSPQIVNGRFYSPTQLLKRLAEGCYHVLLAWAEAEASSAQTDKERKGGAERALHLLDQAAALAEVHQLSPSTAYHLRRSRYLEQRGDMAAARAARAQAELLPPRTALDHFLIALDRYRQGNYTTARDACEEALQQEPDHFWALYLQALCSLRARHWAEAKAGLTGCLNRRPHMTWAWNGRAVACTQLNDPKAAQSSFAHALHDAGDDLARAAVLTNRSALWVQLRRWDDALADLHEAIRLQPNHYQGYASLAEVYRRRQQWALPLFTASAAGLLGSPEGQGPLLAAARIPGNTQDWSRALEAFQKALALQPDDASLYYSRAILHRDRNDPDAARSNFKRAIQLNPKGKQPSWLPTAYVLQGHLQHRAGEYKEALASCDAALLLQANLPDALLQRATTLAFLHRDADAARDLDRYLAREGGKPDVHVARALIHTRFRKYPEAIESYTRALLLHRNAATLARRGWVYLKLESVRPALADFEDALRLNKADPDALCGKGQALVLLGQMAVGLDHVELAVSKKPRDRQLLFNVACTYAKAVEQLAKTPGERDYQAIDQAVRWQERAVAILARLLDQERDKAAFWRDNIQYERNLLSLRNTPGMMQLSQAFAPQGLTQE